MPDLIQLDVQLTAKLWLDDERAWRVSALNITGARAKELFAGGGPLSFRAEGDRVYWNDVRGKRPDSATLHVTIPGDLHPREDLEQQKLALEKQKAADATKLQRVTIFVGLLTAVLGIAGTLGAKTIGEPEKKAACMTAEDARDCRQALLRLQTLSTTAANADDIKKAVQREIVGCLGAVEKVHP